MSDAVTKSIRVEVLSRPSPENSRPLQGEWIFEYTVRITNQGSDTVQLISRHWIITDAFERTEEVQGPGVVGEQPTPDPGLWAKYSEEISDLPDFQLQSPALYSQPPLPRTPASVFATGSGVVYVAAAAAFWAAIHNVRSDPVNWWGML